MTIKHLVLSGGGPILIYILGALKHLESANFYKIDEIESIYGTSAGAIVGVLLCLKYDWETIYDYIIKRPWQDVFPIKVQNILDAYTKKGLFDLKTVEKCFKPLFDAKDISLDINLTQFYEYSKIELHLFSFDVNSFKIVDISYKTHPNLNLITAIQMTCGLPILVMPVCLNDQCFIDGGVVCNYPLQYCIDSGKNPDEILGFKNFYDRSKRQDCINDESTMMDFIMTFLFKLIGTMNTEHIQPNIKNQVICDNEFLSIDLMKNTLKSIDARKKLFESGIQSATKFLEEIEKETQN